MLTYKQCLEMKFRNGQKKLGNNTYLIKIGNDFGVKLHNTVIVKIMSNGDFILNTNDWYTVTTKSRMNDYSPIKVYQKKGNWFLATGEAYHDGIVVRNESNLSLVEAL